MLYVRYHLEKPADSSEGSPAASLPTLSAGQSTFRLDGPGRRLHQRPVILTYSASLPMSSAGQSTLRSDDPGWRLHQRWVILTYFQCLRVGQKDINKAFNDMLHGKGFEKSACRRYRKHEDDKGIHYHVLVYLGKKQPNWSFSKAKERLLVQNLECKSMDITLLPVETKDKALFFENFVDSCETRELL